MNEFREPMSPGTSHDDFLRRSSSAARLTKDEEFALIEDWKKTGNKQSFNRVYLANTKLVYKLAKLYRQVPVGKEDLIQEGMVGLAEAIKGIDTSKGVPLGAYASRWIKAAFRSYILKNHGVMSVTGTQAQKDLFFSLPKNLPVNRRMSSEERKSVAKKLKVTEIDILNMEDRFRTTQASVHHTDPGDDFVSDGSEALPLTDESEGPEDMVLNQMEYDKQKQRFKKRLYKLDPKQRALIQKRYLIAEGERRPTHQEFCEEFGVSRERVRQIEVKALKRMKSLFKKELE